MASAYKCDRCNEFFEEIGSLEPKYSVIKHGFNVNPTELDLCPR